jgi:DNA-binding LacI/PurR family transcriptional regulator
VPDDVAVVGFDDAGEAQLAVPPLTTVRQPLEELGRTMTRVLLARVSGAAVEARTVLPTELVHRASA